MNVWVLRALVTVVLAGCSASPNNAVGETGADYGAAITQAGAERHGGRGADLERCVENWASVGVERVQLPDTGTGQRGDVLLEIGSSGFPAYRFVLVQGMRLKAEGQVDVDVSGTRLGQQLASIYARIPGGFSGSTHGTEDDATCHFLTIRTTRETRTVAFYGLPRSGEAADLVRELMAAGKLAD